jgi:D-alanyl-lipoteichoic acid acyltransferase DltB (MBOAT superfamily)
MIFNSYTFVLFIGLVLLLHYLPLAWKTKKINLLLASYLFYAVWNPPFVLLLWLSTVVDYLMARWLDREENPGKRKALLGVSLAVNLGMLGFFKYGGFLLENFAALVSVLGVDYHPGKPDIILPVGISFYTFQTLSYTLDVYRRKMPAEKSLLDFSLFVTFFRNWWPVPSCVPVNSFRNSSSLTRRPRRSLPGACSCSRWACS